MTCYICKEVYKSLYKFSMNFLRDVVANLRYQSDSDSSGIDGGTVGDRHTDEEGTESENSGATEGPEDNATDSEDSILDNDSFLTNQELQRLQKLPKALHLVRKTQLYTMFFYLNDVLIFLRVVVVLKNVM